MIGILLQIFSVVFGVLGLHYLGKESKFALITGGLGQIGYTALFIYYHQYLMLIAVAAYTLAWYTAVKRLSEKAIKKSQRKCKHCLYYDYKEEKCRLLCRKISPNNKSCLNFWPTTKLKRRKIK